MGKKLHQRIAKIFQVASGSAGTLAITYGLIFLPYLFQKKAENPYLEERHKWRQSLTMKLDPGYVESFGDRFKYLDDKTFNFKKYMRVSTLSMPQREE